MNKQELIKKFKLVKSDKALIRDGKNHFERTLYTNKYNECYVFYDNDLHYLNVHKDGTYSLGLGLKCYQKMGLFK